MRKKLFTLLEILIVILLIALLMAAIKKMFTYKQKDFIRANGCVANIVGQSLNYFYSALTSKGLYVNGRLDFPNKYLLSYSGGNIQKITFLYNTGAGYKVYKQISLTGNGEDVVYGCYSQRYWVKLSGDMSILMEPGLESQNGKIGILLNNNPAQATGEVYFYFIGYGYTGKVLGKLVMDKRTQNFYYSDCLIWTGGGTKCKVWSK